MVAGTSKKKKKVRCYHMALYMQLNCKNKLWQESRRVNSIDTRTASY